MLSPSMPIHLLIISIIHSSTTVCALYAIHYSTPFSLIIISQLNQHLYYHYYAHNLACASLMYLSSFESIGDANFKLVYPPDS